MAIQLPTVAVVTPVYNGAKFLREAMLSVQAQTYPNLVHFVLDNASTDATPDIIKEFDGGRVPVVTARNEALLPIAQNWNRCVELGSQGNDYFRVLCTDESLQPTCIEKMVALAETDPLLSVVGCNHSTTFGLEDLHWDRTRAIFSGSEAARSCLVGECGLATSHLLYRTSVLSLRRKFFEEDASFNFHFDTEAAFFVLTRENARFGYVHEPLGFSHRHAASVTSTVATVLQTDFLTWYTVMDRYAASLLSPAELPKYKLSYKRHYFGRMLAWKYLRGNSKAFDWHIKALASIGAAPSLWAYADAIADYGLRKMRLRRGWNQYPY
jgi:glycosyltransferase involved in cell wall biosynthesis